MWDPHSGGKKYHELRGFAGTMDAGKASGLDDYPYRYNCDAKGVVNSTFETPPSKPSINHTEEKFLIACTSEASVVVRITK